MDSVIGMTSTARDLSLGTLWLESGSTAKPLKPLLRPILAQP